MTKFHRLLIASLLAAPTAALADPVSVQTTATPGATAILSANYNVAEKQLREANVRDFDAGRAINLGVVLAKTGRADLAAAQFQAVLSHDEQTVRVASGAEMSSYAVAQNALTSLKAGKLGQ